MTMMSIRPMLAAGSAIGASLVLAASVAAGGAATATIEGDPPEPGAGEPVEIAFLLKQHDITPISWETAFVVARNADTGETLRVRAEPRGDVGHYVATVTFPSAGRWEWTIELENLLPMNPRPQELVVAESGARTGGLQPMPMLAAVAIAVVVGGAAAVLTTRRRRIEKAVVRSASA